MGASSCLVIEAQVVLFTASALAIPCPMFQSTTKPVPELLEMDKYLADALPEHHAVEGAVP
jgi:hypothetical protein